MSPNMAPPKRHDSKISPATQARMDASSARLPSCPVELYMATGGAASTSRIRSSGSVKKMTSNQRRFLRAAGGKGRSRGKGNQPKSAAGSGRMQASPLSATTSEMTKPPMYPRGSAVRTGVAAAAAAHARTGTAAAAAGAVGEAGAGAGTIASAAAAAERKPPTTTVPVTTKSRLDRERPASLKVASPNGAAASKRGAKAANDTGLDSPNISGFSALSLDTPGKGGRGVTSSESDWRPPKIAAKAGPSQPGPTTGASFLPDLFSPAITHASHTSNLCSLDAKRGCCSC